MFSLPSTGLESSPTNEPIKLDEAAGVVARLLCGIYSKHYAPPVLSIVVLDFLHDTVRAHDKFDIQTDQSETKMALQAALTAQPWTGLAYASHINDLALGKRAIELIRLDEVNNYGSSIWELLSRMKPTWQIALARLILPSIETDDHGFSQGYDQNGMEGHAWQGYISNGFEVNMKDVADDFHPE
jgi:hypothetical protein